MKVSSKETPYLNIHGRCHTETMFQKESLFYTKVSNCLPSQCSLQTIQYRSLHISHNASWFGTFNSLQFYRISAAELIICRHTAYWFLILKDAFWDMQKFCFLYKRFYCFISVPTYNKGRVFMIRAWNNRTYIIVISQLTHPITVDGPSQELGQSWMSYFFKRHAGYAISLWHFLPGSVQKNKKN